MSEAISEKRLNDYVDELLAPGEAAEVERLLAASEEARETVAFLRSLRANCAALPKEIEPERDLWPGISGRMAPAPLATVEASARGSDEAAPMINWLPPLRPSHWAGLAVAAMVLVVSSSAITAWLVGQNALEPAPGAVSAGVSPATATGVALDSVETIEARYAVEIERLLWALYENRDVLDEDTVSTIETNLRVIDRAIRSAREALEDDPTNAGVTRRLTSNYRHKLELLQRAQRIIELS